MWKKIKHIFWAGLATVIPLGITIMALVWLFSWIDSPLRGIITRIIGFYVPGMGIAAIVIIVFLIGLVVSNYLGKKIANWISGLLSKIPLVKLIYNTVKDVFNAISINKSSSFIEVVMVEFPRKGAKSIGFITNEHPHIGSKEEDRLVSVFVPTTPNPTSGFMIFVQKSELEHLDISIDKGLQMVVSMGTINNLKPEDMQK